MTLQDTGMLRAVILPAEEFQLDQRATGRLLGNLGHDVTPANSPAHAMSLLRDDGTDLLIVDISNSADNKEFVNHLADLPLAQRPRELTIFSERMDESLKGLGSRLSGSKVHFFLKPLHVHGLLGVLRHMNRQPRAAVGA